MCCISTISKSVLINGSASNFFHIERGIKKGYPLLPLLFLLVMEGLSRLLSDEKKNGRLKGIKIAENYVLSHLVFVDDFLIFLNGAMSDSLIFNAMLKLFCKATCMCCNHSKSTLSYLGFSQHEIHFSLQIFPFSSLEFEDGLKYLGFRLKPFKYKIVDWSWLVAKIEIILNIWHQIWLSRAGHLVLIKSFLEKIPIYWMSLA